MSRAFSFREFITFTISFFLGRVLRNVSYLLLGEELCKGKQEGETAITIKINPLTSLGHCYFMREVSPTLLAFIFLLQTLNSRTKSQNTLSSRCVKKHTMPWCYPYCSAIHYHKLSEWKQNIFAILWVMKLSVVFPLLNQSLHGSLKFPCKPHRLLQVHWWSAVHLSDFCASEVSAFLLLKGCIHAPRIY